jgi:hypothetical protein
MMASLLAATAKKGRLYHSINVHSYQHGICVESNPIPHICIHRYSHNHSSSDLLLACMFSQGSGSCRYPWLVVP